MTRELIRLIRDLENQPNLPDNPDAWLDEDYPFHDLQSFMLNEAILYRADVDLRYKYGGIDCLVLDTLSVAGCPWIEMSLGRIAFQTRKGKILIVGPF